MRLQARLAAFLLAALLGAPTVVSAQIYHWVDDHGRTHYTDNLHDVPPRHRRDAEDIQEDLRKEILTREAAPHPGAVVPGQRPVPDEPMPAGEPMSDAEAMAALEAMLEEGGGAGALLGALGAGMLGALGVGLLIGLLVLAAFGSLFLILSCRICRTEPPGFVKGMGISFAQMVANLAVSVLAVLLLGVESAQATTFQSASLGWGFLLYAGILHMLHGTPFGTSLLVSVIAMLLTFAVGLGFVFLAFCAGMGAGMVAGAG